MCPSTTPDLASITDLDLRRHQLDNGLRVNLQPDHTLPLVAVNLWYHVGSKNERPGRTGFAHLFEHMLFQGSEHVPDNQHFQHVQKVGGVVNGSTWFDRTNYYETLPAGALDLALWLESDRMGFLLPGIDSEKLENQRSVVMNERRQRTDNRPYGRAFERLQELLWPPGHPYSWPVIGTMEDIAAATLEDVQAFFSTYYLPNNAVLTLCGDFDPDRALEQVERFFGPLASGPTPPPVVADTLPMESPRTIQVEDDVQLSRVYLGFRAPAYGDRSWYAGDLLATALGSGKSSPLYQRLVYERQLAQDVAAYILPLEIATTFYVIATCRPGVDPKELEEELLAELDRAAAGKLAPEHLERARNRTLVSHYQGLQTIEDRADRLSEMTTYFDAPERAMEEHRRYLELESQDLAGFARQFLQRHQRVSVTYLPRSKSNAEAVADEGAAR
ncbi:MAG: pitrilysin family protein [Acidobacteriota bacterium]